MKLRSGPRLLHAHYARVAQRGQAFLWDTRTGAGKTLRPKGGENYGRGLSHRDLSSMTDYTYLIRSLT